jgi:hypothetical protein
MLWAYKWCSEQEEKFAKIFNLIGSSLLFQMIFKSYVIISLSTSENELSSLLQKQTVTM